MREIINALCKRTHEIGDILAKNNQPDLAMVMYESAKLSPNYSSYPFKDILAERIKNVQQNVLAFRTPEGGSSSKSPSDLSPPTRIMLASGYGCVGCHQDAAYVSPEASQLEVAEHILQQFKK